MIFHYETELFIYKYMAIIAIWYLVHDFSEDGINKKKIPFSNNLKKTQAATNETNTRTLTSIYKHPI